jgi:hypothetical protein
MPAETRNPRITYNPDQCGGRPCIATSASPSCTTAPFIDRSVASATASAGGLRVAMPVPDEDEEWIAARQNMAG